ncbi:DUF1775 domain-containing protein [Amycolatopsis nigrescens]|uniref:DUF1775 domain-containing protein n=1 Tax=Amycolatopsis nigrescens TaxID=381445 RepID=UPI00036A3F01|nr:DUF1775 domain-containing protein [Amycolatopsis nigrescens]
MAHHPNIRRFLTVLLASVLATATGLLVTAAPAGARVSIVPGAAKGGGTETFAFRLANERPDTSSDRLELVFPQDLPIAFVEVAPARGWTATVVPRPLEPPVQVGDQTVSEVAGSIVLTGGPVGPGQFEQFLITLGPLPADGRLVFEASQGFTNGAVERWANAAPGSPAITIGAGAGAPAPSARANQGGSASDPMGQTVVEDTGDAPPTVAVLWGALILAALTVALVGLRAHLRRIRPRSPETDPEIAESPESSKVVST